MICAKCKQDLPEDAFYKNKKLVNRNGLTSSCKSCLQVRYKAWRNENPEKALAYGRLCYARRVARGIEHITGARTCGGCKRRLEAAAFPKNTFRCKSCVRERVNAYKAKNLQKVVEMKRRHRNKSERKKRLAGYGLTRQDFLNMLDAQNNLCLTCSTVFDQTVHGKRACIDHCHTTGKVRGLLCSNCNLALGWIRDSPTIARALAAYLEQYQAHEEQKKKSPKRLLTL